MRGHRADKNALRGNNDLCRLCKCCCGRPTANGLSCIAVLKSGYTTVYTLHMYQAHARLACPTEYIPSNFLHCALLSRPIDSYYRLMNVEYVFSLFIFTRSMIFVCRAFVKYIRERLESIKFRRVFSRRGEKEFDRLMREIRKSLVANRKRFQDEIRACRYLLWIVYFCLLSLSLSTTFKGGILFSPKEEEEEKEDANF